MSKVWAKSSSVLGSMQVHCVLHSLKMIDWSKMSILCNKTEVADVLRHSILFSLIQNYMLAQKYAKLQTGDCYIVRCNYSSLFAVAAN